MDIIPKATFSKLGVESLKNAKPCIVTGEGEVIGLWVDPNDIVCLMDLHPTVRRQFKAREELVRRGMPSPVKLTNEEALAKLYKQKSTIQLELGLIDPPTSFDVPEKQGD
jgi:hypothetical protein